MGNRFEINLSSYFPDVSRVELKTLASARAEYSRLRKIAVKRLQRLEKAGYTDSSVYQRYAGAFEPLAKGMPESRVRKKLYEVAKFLSLKGSSVTGEREKVRSTIDALHELGYDFINEENIGMFGRFMDMMNNYMRGKGRDYSSQAIDIFEGAWESGAIDPDELAESFSGWLLEGNAPEEFEYKGKEFEPIPGETETPPAPSKSKKKTPAQKRAEKNRARAELTRRLESRRKRK